MHCIDTNILIEFLRGNNEIIDKLNSLIINNQIFITPINLCELYQGAYISNNSEFKVRQIKELISSFYILEFDENIALEFGKEYARLRSLGKMIDEFDLIIGCFCKNNNLILLTRNKKHFENLGIKIEVW